MNVTKTDILLALHCQTAYIPASELFRRLSLLDHKENEKEFSYFQNRLALLSNRKLIVIDPHGLCISGAGRKLIRDAVESALGKVH